MKAKNFIIGQLEIVETNKNAQTGANQYYDSRAAAYAAGNVAIPKAANVWGAAASHCQTYDNDPVRRENSFDGPYEQNLFTPTW